MRALVFLSIQFENVESENKMIFQTLVECLLKQFRDPDDALAMNAMNTLMREIKHDLTEAFMMSRPLVDRYSSLFWESRSFFDFLLKISKLPLDKEHFAMRPDNDTLLLKEKLSTCQEELNIKAKKLDDCQRQNKLLQDAKDRRGKVGRSVEESETVLTEALERSDALNKELKRLQAANASLQKQLDQCKKELEELPSQNESEDTKVLRENITRLKKMLHDCEEENKVLKEDDKLNHNLKKMLQDCEEENKVLKDDNNKLNGTLKGQQPYIEELEMKQKILNDKNDQQRDTIANCSSYITKLQKLLKQCADYFSTLEGDLAPELSGSITESLAALDLLPSRAPGPIQSDAMEGIDHDTGIRSSVNISELDDSSTKSIDFHGQTLRRWENELLNCQSKLVACQRDLMASDAQKYKCDIQLEYCTKNLEACKSEKAECEKHLEAYKKKYEDCREALSYLEPKYKALEKVLNVSGETSEPQDALNASTPTIEEMTQDADLQSIKGSSLLSLEYTPCPKPACQNEKIEIEKQLKACQTQLHEYRSEEYQLEAKWAREADAISQELGKERLVHLLTTVKSFYNNLPGGWQEHASSQIEGDLTMANVFREQLKKLETQLEWVKVQPDSLAEVLLEQVPDCLKEIAQKAQLPMDQAFAEVISSRLKVYDKMSVLFPNLENWGDQVPLDLQALQNANKLYTDIEGEDWLEKTAVLYRYLGRSFLDMKSITLIYIDKLKWDDPEWLQKVTSSTHDIQAEMDCLENIFRQHSSFLPPAMKAEQDDGKRRKMYISWIEHIMSSLDSFYAHIVKEYKKDMTAETEPEWFKKSVSWMEAMMVEVDSFCTDITKKYNPHGNDPQWFNKSVSWLKRLLAVLDDFYEHFVRAHNVEIAFNDPERFEKSVSWIRGMGDRLRANDAIVKELTQLTPEIECANVWDWKVNFVKKYNALLSHAPSKSSRAKPYDKSEKLVKDCEKLAKKFKFQLNKESFYNDVLDAVRRVESDLKTYLGMDDTTAFRARVEEIFQNAAAQYDMPRPTDPGATLEEHVTRYFAAVHSRWRVEKVDKADMTEEEGWTPLYHQWLQYFRLDEGTPKETFLEKLRESGGGGKRTSGEAFDVSGEKKIKLGENWSLIEIQNLIAALYRELFTLKWQYLNKVVPPTSAELTQNLARKLSFLERIKTKKTRENVLLQAYGDYVKFDLGLWTSKPEMFDAITSVNSILSESMKYTLEHLKRMMNEQDEKMMHGEVCAQPKK